MHGRDTGSCPLVQGPGFVLFCFFWEGFISYVGLAPIDNNDASAAVIMIIVFLCRVTGTHGTESVLK